MSKIKIPCDKCHGSGELEIEQEDAICEAKLVLPFMLGPGMEKIDCWATVQHPGHPHLALLCDRCPTCGGYDEHSLQCPEINNRQGTPSQHWYSWNDGDREVAIVGEDDAHAWKVMFCPINR